VSASRAGHEIKLLNLHPHMTTMVHKPNRTHRTARVNFVNGYLHGVQIGETDPTFVLLNDEAWVQLSGFASSKCRLFHNATFFGSCIIHILNIECAKI
jgi:hypothetical protein